MLDDYETPMETDHWQEEPLDLSLKGLQLSEVKQTRYQPANRDVDRESAAEALMMLHYGRDWTR